MSYDYHLTPKCTIQYFDHKDKQKILQYVHEKGFTKELKHEFREHYLDSIWEDIINGAPYSLFFRKILWTFLGTSYCKKLLTGWENEPEPEIPKKIFNVITVADCHGRLKTSELAAVYENIDKDDFIKADGMFVLLLGDNTEKDIENVLSIIPENIDIYGVVGNHDKKNLLSSYPRINDINGVYTLTKDFSIAGLSGSLRYKDDPDHALITNEESEKILSKMPYVDIFIAHDQPCFQKPAEPDAHSGLTGIAKYIMEKHPQYVFYGHLHDKLFGRYKDTLYYCCYGVEKHKIQL